MTSVNNNIYILCFISFIQLGESKLSLKLFSFDDNKMEKIKLPPSNTLQKFYTYNYSEEKGSVVHIECKSDGSKSKTTLNWQISIPASNSTSHFTNCDKQNIPELNYITKLDKYQNGNNLTCYEYLNPGTKPAIATVNFRCPSCNGVMENSYTAKCYNASGAVRTYINGQRSKYIDTTTVLASKNEIISVFCQKDVDDKHKVELDSYHIPSNNILYSKSISNHVFAFQVKMTNSMNHTEIRCEKKTTEGKTINENKILFVARSNFYIEIQQTGSKNDTWTTYGDTELLYKDNDNIKLTCILKMNLRRHIQWLKDGTKVGKMIFQNMPIYEATLTRQDNKSNLICEAKENASIPVWKRTVVLTYNTLETPDTHDLDSAMSNIIIEPKWKVKVAEWIGIGIAIVLLVIIIIYVVFTYKSRRRATLDATPYTESDTPVLVEPTYAGPIDDVNMYAYTYNQKPVQDTYSSPFVPTLEEMYTKPTPMRSKQKDPIYQLPKITYANLQSSRQNLRSPGHDKTSPNTGDCSSETYTYCAPGYSRP